MAKGSGGGGGSLSGRLPVRTANQGGDGFPRDPNSLTVVKSLGGSTGAQLVEDARGNLFVRKTGADPGHLREEHDADSAYSALRIPVPESKLYETPNGPAKLARFVEGKSLASLSGDARERAFARSRRDFAADALLGNWDVVGLAFDNVIVSGGKAYRIDNGGSLRRRAQGALKKDFDGFPAELWTLRSPAVNKQTAAVFGSVKYGDLMKQSESLVNRRTAILKAVRPELRPTLSKRLDTLNYVTNVYKSLKASGFTDQQIDKLTSRLIVSAKQTGKLPPINTLPGLING